MYAPRHEKPRPEFAKVGLGRPAATPEIAKRHMEQGFLLFQGPTDLGLMAAGARRYLDNVLLSISFFAGRDDFKRRPC